MLRYFLHSAFISLMLHFPEEASGQVKEEFDNLTFYIPAGFTVSKTDNSMLLSDVSAGNGQYFNITVNKSTYSLRKIEKDFPVLWRESLLNEGADNPATEPSFVKAQTNSGWNCFRGGKAVQYHPQAPAFYYHLTVMRYLGITTCVVTRASSEELFIQKYPMLMQLVSSVNFKTQPPSNNTQTVASNPTNPASQTSSGNSQYVQMNGLYISLQGDLLYNAELAALYFSSDGTALADIPEKGFYNLNMQNQRAQFPSSFGSFTATNNIISVKMNNQASTATYTIEPDGSFKSTSNPAQAFKRIEALDNYQFEGTFINRQAGDASKSIVFYRDGRFTDNGLLNTILSEGNESFSAGSGSYSSRQNSLLLQHTNGKQLQLCFYMMPEDFQKTGRPDKILVNNYLLVRQ